MYKLPELLAPVGGAEQLRAAVENGADAVYVGGKLLNARMSADNFAEENLKEAIQYAHMRGVSVYMTLNTLVKDAELSVAMKEAMHAYEMGVDAFIVQDYGLAALLKKEFPEIRLHLSTQGTVYNSKGVEEAVGMGFSRVILARETSLSQIKEIVEETGAPIEVFVHGAMCMCYSGQCQMSRFMGGRSGNRGACAQPCRLPYELHAEGEAAKRRGYLLSPKDMCTIDHIGELAAAGVQSFKIEGRMKSPEYVAIVTGIYRKYINLYGQTGKCKVAEEDREILNQIFSRGGFTEGYLLENPRKTLLSGVLPKHQGIFIGKVAAYKPAQKTILAKLNQTLALGDGVELHNSELSGNVITFMKGGKRLIKAGEVAEIGYLSGNIQPGDSIYKITDKALMERARATYQGKSGQAEKLLRKREITLYFSVRIGEKPVLTVSAGTGLSVTVEGEKKAEKALSRPLSADTAKTQLTKTGGTPFQCGGGASEAEGGIVLDLEAEVTLPISEINAMRRTALEQLEQLCLNADTECRYLSPERKAKARAAVSKLTEAVPREPVEKAKRALYLFRMDEEIMKLAMASDYDRFYFSYRAFLDGKFSNQIEEIRKTGREVLPYLPPVTLGNEDRYIKEHLEEIKMAAKPSGISVGNIGQIALFRNAGISLYGDYGLNLYNTADFRWIADLGFQGGVLGHEAINEEEEAVNFCGLQGEIPIEGPVPLMISAHCPIGDMGSGCQGANEGKGFCDSKNYCLKDRKNRIYPILTENLDCRSIIFSENHRINKKIIFTDQAKRAAYHRIYGIDKNVFSKE